MKMSNLRRLLVALLFGWLCLPAAQAHLMVAQHGTLNLVGDGAFMVLSLPVAAFEGIDDDGDGRLSTSEFMAHRVQIAAAIKRNVTLSDAQGARPLEGMLMSLVADDASPTAPAAQLVVMGRFALAPATADAAAPLRLQVGLYGKAAAEQRFEITASRANRTESALLILTPSQPSRALFPSALSVFGDFVGLGAEHVLTGIDHLLFLLVVLSAGFTWRQAALALTCFTLGHAVTLTASLLGGFSVPDAIVEPAIAATIVGMALYDRWCAGRARKPAAAWRLSLVFGCALIHGLGLAGALGSMGLDSTHQLLSLAGFNVGIEAAQLGVAVLTGTLLSTVQTLRGPRALALTTRFASFAALAAGSIWLVERTVFFA